LVGYYLVGEARHLVAVNEANVANRESQLQLAWSRFNSGLGGADDVLTAQTAKGDAVIGLVQARTTEDAARVSLLQTLGLDPQTPAKIGEDAAAPIVIDKFDDFVAQALQRRPEVLRAQSAIDAARYGARAARTTTAPTLSGNVWVGSNDPGFPWGGSGYGLGLVLSVPLYDGNLTAGAVQEARAALKSAQADLATAQLQVRTDVSQAYLAVRGAEQQDEAARINVVNARESLRIAEGRYKSGVGLFLDIINAQAALLTAETAAATSQAEMYRQRATLQRAAGMLAPQ
jgi:outer membrane protein